MEVTRENLEDAFEEFSLHASKSRYCAIDLEMTGIDMVGAKLVSTDSLEERYIKMREVASKYNMIQIGFCLVENEYNTNDFVLRSYNCYVFPTSSYQGSGPYITMEASAVEFNTAHGMDWNKWIREGVSYVNSTQFEKKEKSMLVEAENDKKEFNKEIVVKTASDTEFISTELDKFRAWFTENLATFNESDLSTAALLEYKLPQCNSFLRGALFTAINKEFRYVAPATATTATADVTDDMSDSQQQAQEQEHVAVVEVKYPSATPYLLRPEVRGSGWNSTGHLLLISQSQLESHLKAREVARSTAFNKGVGMHRFWKCLLDNKLGFIGHNCYYDILFLYHHLHNSLPATFNEFRTELDSLFPEYYDTKLIYSNPEFQKLDGFVPSPTSTHLGQLFKIHSDAYNTFTQQQQQGEVEVDEEKKEETTTTTTATTTVVYNGPTSVVAGEGYDAYGADSNKFHEAGYDAYCTAYLFCSMLGIMRNNDKTCTSRSSHSSCDRVSDGSCSDSDGGLVITSSETSFLTKFNKHTYSMFSFYATNLKPDATLADCIRLVQGNVLVMTNFAETTNNNDITTFFKIEVSNLRWINNFIVTLINLDDANVARVLEHVAEHPDWKLTKLEEYLNKPVVVDTPTTAITTTTTTVAPLKRKFVAAPVSTALDTDDSLDGPNAKKAKYSLLSSVGTAIIASSFVKLLVGLFKQNQ